MRRLLLYGIAAALAGAIATALFLVLAYSQRAAVVLEMDQPLPATIASGIYAPEREGPVTFAWTGPRADISLPGATRRGSWGCTVRVRGARTDTTTLPRIVVAVDGLTVTDVPTTNEYSEVKAVAPARPRGDGLTLTIAASSTVTPGAADPRQLGVQLDRISCRPEGAAFPWPPTRVLRDATISGTVLGFAFGLSGLALPLALFSACLVAAGQAFAFAAGLAPYAGLAGSMLPIATWIAAALLVLVMLFRSCFGRGLSTAALFVLAFSGVALYLKLAGLLHPAKPLVDAVFHAHRFEWVLDGRYYFTQGMPGGVSFPYAIGLYLFAAPWAALTNDYITLLRIVVTASEVCAGALLYPLVLRNWSDRLAGVVAVVLFNLVPLPYGLIGNANMTNAFGQSAALATLVAAATWTFGWRRPFALLAFFALASLAFLSHVSTFSLLAVTLCAFGALCWVVGDRLARPPAVLVVTVTIAAALFAVGTYYGHFADVYRTAWRARTAAAAAPARPAQGGGGTAPRVALPLRTRAADALLQTTRAVGWPTLLLAAIGAWRVAAGRRRDRATLLVGAWLIAYVLFLGVALMRVDVPFQRYAAEFVGRVVFATYPATVVLAGVAVTWGWRSRFATRLAAAALVLAAVVIGVRQWAGWFF